MFLGVAAAIVSTRALAGVARLARCRTAVLMIVSLTGVFEDPVDEDGFVGIVGFASFILLLVWFLAASIVMFMRAGGDGPYDEPGQLRAPGTMAT